MMRAVLRAAVPTLFACATAAAQPCGPDLAQPILEGGPIYDVDGADLITVLPVPFEDGALEGQWLAVPTEEFGPLETIEILGNVHYDQWNISVITVDEDLESLGGSNWWMYLPQDAFAIVRDLCEPTPLPAAPLGLTAASGDGSISLEWSASSEPDLAGYRVHRSLVSNDGYAPLHAGLLTGTSFVDTAVTNGTTYFYVVTAVDTEGLESTSSALASAVPHETTPPAAPTGLVAIGGDDVVELDWADNGEADLAGYFVYRATASGGPYSKRNWSPLAASAYTDTAVANGVTYHYVVTAADVSGNESTASGEASATPSAPTATTLHVASIDLSVESLPGNRKRGVALVTVVDDLGAPVAGAQVTGTFTGSFSQGDTATTDANGVARLETSKKKVKNPAFTFCVTSISHGSLTYAPGDDVETCDTY